MISFVVKIWLYCLNVCWQTLILSSFGTCTSDFRQAWLITDRMISPSCITKLEPSGLPPRRIPQEMRSQDQHFVYLSRCFSAASLALVHSADRLWIWDKCLLLFLIKWHPNREVNKGRLLSIILKSHCRRWESGHCFLSCSCPSSAWHGGRPACRSLRAI